MIEPDPAASFIGQVFKIGTDPKSNIKYLAVRVHSGTLTSDLQVRTVQQNRGTRPGHVMRAMAADHQEIEAGEVLDGKIPRRRPVGG